MVVLDENGVAVVVRIDAGIDAESIVEAYRTSHNARMMKGGRVFLDATMVGDEVVDMDEILALPGSQLMLDCREWGDAEEGWAVVVCTLDGNPLMPYYIPQPLEKRKEYQARFSLTRGNTVVIVTYCVRSEDMITLEKYKLRGKRLMREFLWEGSRRELPLRLGHFMPAVRAAVDKVKKRKYHHSARFYAHS